jgi:hypothetical protein
MDQKLIVVIILLIIIITSKYYIDKIKRKSNYKFCILLTSCYNRENYSDQELQKIQGIYRKVINRWLNKTNIPIFVVDSSNYTYPEFSNTRLRVCSFTFSQLSSSTICEANSIFYALENCKELSNYDYVIKVTGKYYIPFMYTNISYVLDGHDLYFQQRRNFYRRTQNSEVFGFKYKLGKEIVTPIVTGESKLLMEQTLSQLSHSENYTHSRFLVMINFYLSKRGDGGILYLL